MRGAAARGAYTFTPANTTARVRLPVAGDLLPACRILFWFLSLAVCAPAPGMVSPNRTVAGIAAGM